jgi:hypothetical protein
MMAATVIEKHSSLVDRHLRCGWLAQGSMTCRGATWEANHTAFLNGLPSSLPDTAKKAEELWEKSKLVAKTGAACMAG